LRRTSITSEARLGLFEQFLIDHARKQINKVGAMRTSTFWLVVLTVLTFASSIAAGGAGGVAGGKPAASAKVTLKPPAITDPPAIAGTLVVSQRQDRSFWGVQTNLQQQRDRQQSTSPAQKAKSGGAAAAIRKRNSSAVGSTATPDAGR
jgi:hypothetical protein